MMASIYKLSRLILSSSLHRHVQGNALHGLLHQQFDHSIQTPSLLVGSDLAIGPCASWIFEQVAQIGDFPATAQIISDLVHKIQEFAQRLSHAETTLLPKINQICIQTEVDHAPLVLFDEVTR